jgi:hypothetical protein
MNNSFGSRVFALAFFSAGTGAIIAHDEWKKHLMGKTNYLQIEATRFDKHLAHMSHPIAGFIGFTIFIGGCMAIYEGIAFISKRLFDSKGSTVPMR